ncbi:MAG TPA: substrate-binding domain-containing protein [Burkholderiales bacterium]|jgi:molybdate transport repressor ModE-like protein|nr:substrate-binding domain-containing protein [Burkholderiales bacterium]
MFKVSIKPQWTIKHLDTQILPKRLIELLVDIHEHGSIAAACEASGASYRYAWGLLQEGQTLFGAPLVNMARGKSATLSALGEKLVWADRRIAARLSPALDSLASELEVEIERALSAAPPVMRIHASHGFAVETLRGFLIRAQIPVDLKYRGSQEAVASLASAGCDLAGFHIPLGDFERRTIAQYTRWLDPATQTLINIATRRQGLMVARGNPKKIYGLTDLTRPEVRFINRQQGSGTRILFDMLLEHQDIDGRKIQGYDEGEYTHAAVAAYIASGMADAGFGIETPARQFNLEFLPVETERYFLICKNETLEQPQVQRMLEILRSAEYHTAVDALPGYNGARAGEVESITGAFPDWPGESGS